MEKNNKIKVLEKLLAISITDKITINFWETKNYWKGQVGYSKDGWYIEYYGHNGYSTTGRYGVSRNISKEEALQILLPHFTEIHKEYSANLPNLVGDKRK